MCLDLDLPQISYTLNGIPIRGCFKDFNTEGMFFPAISMSAKSRWVVGVDGLGDWGTDCVGGWTIDEVGKWGVDWVEAGF